MGPDPAPLGGAAALDAGPAARRRRPRARPVGRPDPARMTDTLPDNVGYVAAAYLVFLALVLVYVAIMASKLVRIERDLTELTELAEERAAEREPVAR